MLIVFLFVGIAIYMGLYFAWDFLSGHLVGPTAWLASFQRMILWPEPLIFQMLRGLILVIVLYLIGDFLMSLAKNGLKKKPPPDEMKLKVTPLPPDRTKR